MKPFKQRNKRIFLVNRDFQLRYTRIAVVVGLVSTLLTVFLILYPLFYLDILRFPAFVPLPFLLGIGVACCINFAAIAFISIHMTHRIAGPIFSLVRQMRLLQAGRWDAHLKVRTADDMKYLIRNFNELVDYMVETSRRDLIRVSHAIDKLRSLNTDGLVEDLTIFRDELAMRIEADKDEDRMRPPE